MLPSIMQLACMAPCVNVTLDVAYQGTCAKKHANFVEFAHASFKLTFRLASSQMQLTRRVHSPFYYFGRLQLDVISNCGHHLGILDMKLI